MRTNGRTEEFDGIGQLFYDSGDGKYVPLMDVKEESDIDSLFSAGGTSALMSEIRGLDDFELICFLVVK